MELPGLNDGVASGGGVGHQKNLVGCRGIEFSEGAANLGQLLHEVRFGVESSGGVADQEVGFQALCLGKGVMAERGRIRSVGAGDDLDAELLSPGFELLDGRRAESVGRAEKDGMASRFEKGGELGAAGGLAGAVHPHHQDDDRPVRGRREIRSLLGKMLGCFGPCGFQHIVRMEGKAFVFQGFQDGRGRGCPKVGLPEQGLDLFPVNRLMGSGEPSQNPFQPAGHQPSVGWLPRA